MKFLQVPSVFVAITRAHLYCLLGLARHVISAGKAPLPRLFTASEGIWTQFIVVMTGDFAHGDQKLERVYFGSAKEAQASLDTIREFKSILKQHWQPA